MIFILVSILLLSSCANRLAYPPMAKEGASEYERKKDAFECKTMAASFRGSLATGVMAGNNEAVNQYYTECMELRGYKPIAQEPSQIMLPEKGEKAEKPGVQGTLSRDINDNWDKLPMAPLAEQPSTQTEGKYRNIKGIILNSKENVYGEILSISAEKVAVRTKEGIKIYKFADVYTFIKD